MAIAGFNLEYSTANYVVCSPRNQLPRQERETFMGLLRFLSLPVDDVWFSAILLILVRQGKDGKGWERMGKDGGRAAWCFLWMPDLDCYYLLLETNSYQLFQWFGFTLEHVLVKRRGKRSTFRD